MSVTVGKCLKDILTIEKNYHLLDIKQKRAMTTAFQGVKIARAKLLIGIRKMEKPCQANEVELICKFSFPYNMAAILRDEGMLNIVPNEGRAMHEKYNNYSLTDQGIEVTDRILSSWEKFLVDAGLSKPKTDDAIPTT